MNGIQNVQNVNFRADYLNQTKRIINKPFNYLDNKIDLLKARHDNDYCECLKVLYRALAVLGCAQIVESILPH